MSREPIYKAISTQSLRDAASHFSRAIRFGPGCSVASAVQYVIDQILDLAKLRAHKRVMDWFAETGRDPQTLNNVYIRQSGDEETVITTWTFNDRDTALLFKLSLN